MPDTACVSLVFIGAFFGLRYLDQGNWKNYSMFLLFIILGPLVKIPAAIYLALPGLAVLGSGSVKRKLFLAFGVGLSVLSSGFWYWGWNVHLSETYNTWYNLSGGFAEGLNELISNPHATIERFYFSSMHSFVFLLAFLVGAYFLLKHRQKHVLIGIGVITLVFLVYAVKSGFLFQKKKTIPS